ncbi:CYTH and CHAD domain-containing protein [Micromonospora siamensis]|uniref:CHAD domain-containing protein n=1 Tax=Micromonospora siamensis TaxID=299152 RepID=A0A1C5HLR3_9ACTN|nr:CYTH and CHAD domain-containing protein [Micromonospora siamensis]SCG46960.1 CHAD domain-containing protein [Micromonospora siamensis]
MVEEERKYEVADDFVLPDLSPVAPAGGAVRTVPPVTLVASYVDTADLRLARAGVSLRHREGDALPWTVKLPTGAQGVRHEISRPGPPGEPPAELAALVTVHARGAALGPVAVVRTVRDAYEVCGRDGAVLAEVVDDRVTVLDAAGRTTDAFRELEVERKAGDRALLDDVGAALEGAGARGGAFVPKHVRALGPRAQEPADLVAPAGLPAVPTAGEVAVEAVRDGVARILANDPLVRLRAPVGDDDSAVHKMRVGCRRLRSALRTFRRLLEREQVRPLRAELTWLGEVLGAARDAEVLRERLRRTASADPTCPVPPEPVDALDAALAARQEAALAAVDTALRSPRYLALVDALVSAAGEPRLRARAARPARKALPKLVAKPWRTLTEQAPALAPDGPDDEWHAVRKAAKQARYAVRAVAPVAGADARKLGRALARVQDLLGEHQDAAVAGRTWVALAAEHPDGHGLAVAAGRLLERERGSVRRARTDFPAAWRRAGRRSRTRWLP